jgi:hypothetical protein
MKFTFQIILYLYILYVLYRVQQANFLFYMNNIHIKIYYIILQPVNFFFWKLRK